MSTTTPNLGLFKYNTSTDANSAFNINTALNNNWDIIDNALTNVDALPDQTGKDGYILTTNGSEASWGETDEIYPVIEAYQEGNSWYRVYSDGWCEQGGLTGKIADYGTATVNLLKSFKDLNYTITKATMMPSTSDDASYNDATCIRYATRTNSSFEIYNRGASDGGRFVNWQASGYIEV